MKNEVEKGFTGMQPESQKELQALGNVQPLCCFHPDQPEINPPVNE